MNDERGRWIWRLDAVLWTLGAILMLVAIGQGLRSGHALAEMLQSVWGYSAGGVFVIAALCALVLFFRWRASRDEAELLRKYPPRT